jgi:serine/threonine protein kinase
MQEKYSWSTCYSFLDGLLQAVDYLHYEDLSSQHYFTSTRIRKPIIIHRDIKSSNVLVKSNPQLTLCLTDFGLAKILSPILTANDFIQIGTYRYMAPELLELAISHTSEALCKVDMYATGLVLWEIISQCDDYPSRIIVQQTDNNEFSSY